MLLIIIIPCRPAPVHTKVMNRHSVMRSALVYFTYRRILPAVLMMSVLAEGAAPIQLNVELVVVSARPINVHAIGIVRVACN